MKGYSKNFIPKNKIDLPILNEKGIAKLFHKDEEPDKYLVNYINFSLLQSSKRKFPIYTASNIDGSKFYKIPRKELFGGSDHWKKDSRLGEDFQFGKELYSAKHSDFDRGHLVKREDVQWGDSIEEAKEAAKATFFFTNSVPQMAKMNRGIWRELEDYILHDETIDDSQKISLFTGPILKSNDPIFVTKVEDKNVKLPVLFWKIVYYVIDKQLYRTGFIVGQRDLLEAKGVVGKMISKGKPSLEFQQFEEADTYQVKVSLIEKLSRLSFSDAKEVFKDDRGVKLVIKETNYRSKSMSSRIKLNIQL